MDDHQKQTGKHQESQSHVLPTALLNRLINHHTMILADPMSTPRDMIISEQALKQYQEALDKKNGRK